MNADINVRIRQFGPDRELRLTVPVDVPLSELLGDFIDAAEEDAYEHRLDFEDWDGWTLQLPDGSAADGECMDELGVLELGLYDALRADPPLATTAADGGAPAPEPQPETHPEREVTWQEPSRRDEAGTRFLRHQRRQERRADRDEGPEDQQFLPGPEDGNAVGVEPPRRRAEGSRSRPARVAPRLPNPPRSRGRGSSTQRIVRARAEAALPTRMGPLPRALQALSALSPAYDLREAEAFGLDDPARFMRQNGRPARQRVRDAWWSTDYERLLEAAILMPSSPGCQTVAVLSPKGGVGKTTITALTATLLSFVRHTIVVAVDANPDMSNLASLLSPGRGEMIDRLLAGPLAHDRFSPREVLGRLGDGPNGVYVAPSPNDPRRQLAKASYEVLYGKLKQIAEVLVLDCGTGLTAPAAQAALETADQLVVVVDGRTDTMAMVASAECQAVLRAFPGPVFLVVNKITRRVRRRINLTGFESELAFSQGIVEVAYDERAAEGMTSFRWDDRPPTTWGIQVRELAALITTSWPGGPGL